MAEKTIGGITYNTDTATLLAKRSRDVDDDLDMMSETLYRKPKNGEYFLFGEGGPMTRYANRGKDGDWGAGWGIIPMSFEEARTWAKENLERVEYAKLFGPVEETGIITPITLRIDSAAKTLLRRESSRVGKSMGDVVQRLVMENLQD